MTERTAPESTTAPQLRTRRFRIGAVIAIAVVVGLILWLTLRGGGNSSNPAQAKASAVSEDQLKTLASNVGHPVFWVGPKPGYTYELTQTSNGAIYVRYLPAGEKVGARKPYLTVATYPFTNAYGAIRKVTRQKNVTTIRLKHGGLAEVASTSPDSVHAAYPGVDYQIEVFDPTAGAATGLVTTGLLEAFGSLRPKTSAGEKPTAATPAQLKALAKTLSHPLYWIGAKRGYAYELTQTRSGQVYVRYLPPGVSVGSKHGYTTIATYPFHGAFAAILAVGKQKDAKTINLPNGGRAVITTNSANDIHLAYPGRDYEIEVYDPSAARARQIVTSGQLTPIG